MVLVFRRENVAAGNHHTSNPLGQLDHFAHEANQKRDVTLYNSQRARGGQRLDACPPQVRLVLRAGFSIKTYAHRNRVQGAGGDAVAGEAVAKLC